MEYSTAQELDELCLADGHMMINLSKEEAESLLPDEVEVVIKAYVLPCVLAVGLFGNILFLIVVARVPSIRTITNFYLVNLAVADLIYLTVGVGEKLWRFHSSLLGDDPTLTGSGCSTISFVVDFACNASVLLITAVTIERYYAICKPFWHRRIATWGRTRRIVFATWLLSCVFAALLIPGNFKMIFICLVYPDEPAYEDFPTLIGICQAVSLTWVAIANALQLIPFFLALIVNSILYALIIRSLTARIKTEAALHTDRYRYTKERNAVTRMLVITGVLFFLLYFPYHVVILALLVAGMIGDDTYFAFRHKVNPFFPIFQTLMYINSANNPYIYGATNARYRRALKKTFACGYEARDIQSVSGHKSADSLKHYSKTSQTKLKKMSESLATCLYSDVNKDNKNQELGDEYESDIRQDNIVLTQNQTISTQSRSSITVRRNTSHVRSESGGNVFHFHGCNVTMNN
ncbi:thyrotropin-releasing hormone receptor-like [Diadema antillarum]|uniref:thyrotropin-releasing hormone receptor-like n=1 Tax=Diadema antillarum TaxID=105358 RepID=UPI003A838B7E